MTVTVSAAETEVVPAAVTVSEKVSVPPVVRLGAVNIGLADVPVSLTVGVPPV